MNSFDKKQIEILTPLYKNKVVLHFAFFANTFPIAYHYTQLLKGEKDTKIKDYIKLHDWNNLLPSGTPKGKFWEEKLQAALNHTEERWKFPQNINLFYASDIHYKNNYANPLEKIRQYFIKDFKDLEFLTEVPFTKYAPRFVFLKNNLFNYKIAEPKNCQYDIDTLIFKQYSVVKNYFTELALVLRRARSNGIKNFIVYTDLVHEAKDIFAGYKLTDENTDFYDKDDLGTLVSFNHLDKANTLQIYYYGAPTSFDLLQKKDRYIPVILEEGKLHDGLRAVACLHYNSTHKSKIRSIESAIVQYQNGLFEKAADSDAPEKLNNIRLAYNRFASLIRHDTRFDTPESFSNCITLFNKSYSEKEEEIKDKSKMITIKPSKDIYHFHFGAGRLSIGLVLPSFKASDKEEKKYIYVFQKRREEWRKRIRIDNKKIKLINNIDYNLEFKLFGKCPRLTKNNTFVLYNNLQELKEIITRASSISYSLDNKNMEKELVNFLLSNEYISKKVYLFPFENNPINHNEEPELMNHLNNHDQLIFTRVKADRICIQRNFESNNTINVECEEHAEIIIDNSDDYVKSLFSSLYRLSNNIIFTSSKEQFQFLANRKKLLLNELHFILAIYGYAFLVSKEIIHWEHQYVTILQAALENDPNYSIPINTFIKLQIIRLFLSDKYTIDTMNDIYGVSGNDYEMLYENLLKYAEKVKARFNNSKEDSISRVFNTLDVPTIKRKYNSIIKEIELFLFNKQIQIEKFPLVSGSTYGEFRYFLEDVKSRVSEIFKMRVKIQDMQIKEIAKEHLARKQDLKFYSKEIRQILT
ncbi:MAG: hypothetical protein K9J16_00150 [Melioribacteraceae bacterium]|nr:hypothetical protein [Melioribacteraceae bacterium]MCF8353920.1 hypothetical protein [Melioribacteraceae bacterium]MCF8392677.1 hypothetical protein [Melioribacteraceae bacterium]MCF8417698.1 hypothetical protein [Melioribacteraceae bacterium]